MKGIKSYKKTEVCAIKAKKFVTKKFSYKQLWVNVFREHHYCSLFDPSFLCSPGQTHKQNEVLFRTKSCKLYKNVIGFIFLYKNVIGFIFMHFYLQANVLSACECCYSHCDKQEHLFQRLSGFEKLCEALPPPSLMPPLSQCQCCHRADH